MVNLAQARRERTSRLRKVRREDSDFYPFGGGLNLIDSPLSSEPGQVQSALNYEMGFVGGYKRVGGYEGFDGTPSVANPDYHLLPFAATKKPAIFDSTGNTTNEERRQLIVGQTSDAHAHLMVASQDGGYGTNVILSNSDLEDTTYWDPAAGTGTVTVLDEDYTWVDGIIPTLSQLRESNDGGASTHTIEQLLDPISIAIGDMLYVSFFAKYDGDPTSTILVPRSGIRLVIENAVGDPFGLPSSAPYIEFNLRQGVVFDQSAHWLAFGIDNLGNGVVRCWGRTKFATVADASLTLSYSMMQEPTPTTLTESYQGNNTGIVHFGGPMAVVMPRFTPHNTVEPIVLSTALDWFRNSVTVTDGASVWTSGIYPTFSRIADTAVTNIHTITAAENSATEFKPIKVVKGDKVFIEFYARWTSGQQDGHYIQTASSFDEIFDSDIAAGLATVYINYNQGGTIADTPAQSNMETVDVEEIETDIFRVRLTTVAAVGGGTTFLTIGNAEEVTATEMNRIYDGTGLLYTEIIGIRVQVIPEGGDDIKLGHAVTGDAAVTVPTGNLVVAGSVTGGPFVKDEQLDVRAYNVDAGITRLESLNFGSATGPLTTNSEPDAALSTAYTALATAAITTAKPPGGGPIRGVWMHRGFLYAFRDSAEGDVCNMWKATGAGWLEAGTDIILDFDGGDGTEPAEGATVVGVTSASEGVIKRIITTSGVWGVDAAGYIILARPLAVDSGVFENNEVLNVSSTRIADADGDSSVQSFSPGGRFEFRSKNFYGHVDQYRMYGVNGLDNGFEYDDVNDVNVPIRTGMTVDAPTHLAVHNKHLFFAFKGGSVQLSGDGDPLSWTVITGASEIGVGDEISGFNEEVGNSLFIFTRDTTSVLQGNTRANFDLDDFNVNAGAHEWSLQRIGLGTYFDDRGFTTLLQTQRQGSVNFQENTQSELIQPLVENLVRTAKVKTSHLIRNQNLYRCYFDDGRIVSIGFSQHKVSGHMPLEYPFIANVSVSEEDTNGAERTFVGADDGSVYEIEHGTTFDGDDIRAFMRTVLYHSGSPGQFKKYTHARLDATLTGALTMLGRIEYDFDDPDWNLGADLDFTSEAAGGYWDAFVWDNFIWDKATSGNPQVKLEGEGTNASVYLYSTSSIDSSHTLRGMSLQWLPRRSDRRV